MLVSQQGSRRLDPVVECICEKREKKEVVCERVRAKERKKRERRAQIASEREKREKREREKK